jgi:hypothetical protein
MNDGRSGQLTSGWTIPPYARELLALDAGADSVKIEGEKGLFTLDAPADALTVRWGSDGAGLTQLAWRVDTLEWDGTARIGGMVEAIHITELPGMKFSVGIIQFEGQPVRPGFQPYPAARHRSQVPYASPDFFAGVDEDIDPGVTTWLVADESALMPVMMDALMNKQRLYVYGRLADEKMGWHKHVALPLLLESVTLFAT